MYLLFSSSKTFEFRYKKFAHSFGVLVVTVVISGRHRLGAFSSSARMGPSVRISYGFNILHVRKTTFEMGGVFKRRFPDQRVCG